MGPRSSISGELPIDSYFGSVGAISNKENGSRKRRTGASADEANRTQTKKQRTTQPPKATNLEAQGKSRSGSAEARQKVVTAGVSKTRTTSMPTPISAVKLPHSTSSRVPADTEVITITSSSPPREVLPDAGGAARSARNTASAFGLPTPQTVSHEAKKNPRTDAAVSPPTVPTVSRSAMNSRPVIPSFSLPPQPPLTPSRPKNKPNHIPLAHRTTPHSQRIVPSSQWSDDEQPNAAPSLEANRNPFLLHRTDESGSCPDDLTFLPPSDVPTQSLSTLSLTSVKVGVSAHPTFIEPAGGQGWSLENNFDTGDTGDTRTCPLSFKLSDLSRSVLWSSNDLGLRDRGQNSQIEPTSQLDEIELKALSQRLSFVDPIPSPQTNNCGIVPSVERPQTIPPQDESSHSESIVEPKSSSTDAGCKPSPPPSPLTPLSSSSSSPSASLLSDAMHRDIDTMGANRSPSQQPLALRETPESASPRSSPEPMVDLELCGTSQSLPEMEIPIEDPTSPTSREDENSPIHPSPVRRSPPPANVENPISPSDDSPSPVAHSHARISHAKLRSLPDPAIELDSDGEEMSPTSSFSIPATSQGMSMSHSASSCLDLIGTLPSEVGDFFDMVDAYASSQS